MQLIHLRPSPEQHYPLPPGGSPPLSGDVVPPSGPWSGDVVPPSGPWSAPGSRLSSQWEIEVVIFNCRRSQPLTVCGA